LFVISKGRSKIRRFPGDKLPEIKEKFPHVAKQLFGESERRLQESYLKIVKLLNGMKQVAAVGKVQKEYGFI